MLGRKNQRDGYNPDDDPWDDRALIQAYNDSVKLHTSMLKQPRDVPDEEIEISAPRNRQKRQHAQTQPSAEHEADSEEVDEEVESSEEAQSMATAPSYGFSAPFPSAHPYHMASAPHPYQQFPMGSYYPSYASFPGQTPERPSKSKKSNPSTKRTPSSASAAEYDAHEVNEEANGQAWTSPKAKKSKRSEPAYTTHPYHQYAQGLYAPNFNDVPMGYTPQAPPMPNWWSQTSGPWSTGHQYTSAPPSTPDNASLWAYYYYGYAMGQYDAFTALSSDKK